MYFVKCARFSTCWCSNSGSFTNFFLSTLVLKMGSLVLERWATTVADLNLWHISSNSTFPFNVVTFLFHGGPFSITSGTLYGSHGVIYGLWYCTKHNEKYRRTASELFLLKYTIYWKGELLTQR